MLHEVDDVFVEAVSLLAIRRLYPQSIRRSLIYSSTYPPLCLYLKQFRWARRFNMSLAVADLLR